MSDFEDAGRQPSEEELRQYLMQLRAADPGEFIAQAFNILATGAQAKIGLNDARALIDGMSALVDAVAPHVPDEIAEPMRNGVVQLKTAQVQAERELADEPEQAGAAPGTTETPPQAEGEGRLTDRLWVPGRQPPNA